MSPGWLIFLYQLSGVGGNRGWPLPERFRGAGFETLALSLVLWLWAFAYLGLERTLNGNVFGRGPTGEVMGGPFRLVENPMYDSYIQADLTCLPSFVGARLIRTWG